MALYVGKNTNSAQLIAANTNSEMVLKVVRENFLHEIGTIKLLALTKQPNIESLGLEYDSTNKCYQLSKTNPEKFNGWVPANGNAYGKASFPKAFAKFSTSGASNVFNVPNLDHFISAQPNNGKISLEGSSSLVIDHTHEIDTAIQFKSGVIRDSLKLQVADNYGNAGLMVHPDRYIHNNNRQDHAYVNASSLDYFTNGNKQDYVPQFHNGCGDYDVTNEKILRIDLQIPTTAKFEFANTGSAGIDDNYEICPSHVKLLAMVYIGMSFENGQ